MLAKYYAPPHQTQPGTGIVADLGTGPGGPGMGGLSSLKDQKAFEKGLWEKIRRGGGESSPSSFTYPPSPAVHLLLELYTAPCCT